MASRVPLYIEAGATFSEISFQYLEDDGVTPIDLTDYTAQMQIRDRDDALALEITPTIDVETATISFELTAEETSELTDYRYLYAIELAGPENDPVIRLAEGSVTVSREVVR